MTIRGAVPCRRRGQPAQPGAAPAAISNAEEAKATKAKADKLLNAGKISTAEHRLIQRAVDRVLNRESAPIEGKSAKPRLDRPGRRMKREEGGRVQPELRSYEPTFRDKVARGLSSVIAGDEKLSPMQHRAVEGLAGSTGNGRSGVGLIDLLPPGLLRALESDEGGVRKAYAGGGGIPGPTPLPTMGDIHNLGRDEAIARAEAKGRAIKAARGGGCD